MSSVCGSAGCTWGFAKKSLTLSDNCLNKP